MKSTKRTSTEAEGDYPVVFGALFKKILLLKVPFCHLCITRVTSIAHYNG